MFILVQCCPILKPLKCKIRIPILSLHVQEFIELPPSQFSSNGSVSLLQFHLHSGRDYGTVQCRATNTIGTQLQPCTVTLVRRGGGTLGDCNDNGLIQKTMERVKQRQWLGRFQKQIFSPY